jgi:hypothetical protein
MSPLRLCMIRKKPVTGLDPVMDTGFPKRSCTTKMLIQRAASAAVNKRTQKEGRAAEAFAVDGPAIVDCVVAADELPNIPHIELDLASHYAIAKIKETVIAVTGR